nr:MAG TPA: hypothetical protein [Caudoviricetes sp.]DAV48517.1 MAG TPA: hypothetical protein [Caudoviricetes sp.]
MENKTPKTLLQLKKAVNNALGVHLLSTVNH